MSGYLNPIGFQFFDSDGNPLNGGKLYAYEAGTTTPATMYTSVTLLTPTANPLILDSEGYGVSFIADAAVRVYKFTLTNSADVEQWTINGVSVPSTAAP